MMIAYRELYCPAHFGNSYEVMWPKEMKEILSEAKHWGFNVYGDWFDSADLKNPYENPRNEFLLPQALWERKMAHFQTARRLGFSTDLVVTPNHVFLNQLAPGLLADTSEQRFFGQLLCPSKQRAREIILANYQKLFEDLHEHGVSLDSISGCPYDYGGCACSSCHPWIVTFGKLLTEIHELAKRFFPEIKARLIGWWWTEDDHDMFKRWADAEEPGRFASLAAAIPYGETSPGASLALPEGCERHAFVHIGYGDRSSPSDVYGPWGPVVAPARIPATVTGLHSMAYEGFMAYSEGVFDDINKALLGGLSSDQFSDADAVLQAYAERYLGACGAEREDWAEWTAQWGSPFEVDTRAARRDFEKLSKGACASWRLAQLDGKLSIFEAHNAVREASQWNENRLADAERFFAERERLQRGIWGLGLVRHVLNETRHQPDWFEEWQSSQSRAPRRSSEQPLPEA